MCIIPCGCPWRLLLTFRSCLTWKWVISSISNDWIMSSEAWWPGGCVQPCSCITYQTVTRRTVCVLGGCGPWWCCVTSAGTAGAGCPGWQGVCWQWCTVLFSPLSAVICSCGQNSSHTRLRCSPSASSRWCVCRSCEDAGARAKLPQSPQERDPLASFFDQSVKERGEVLGDVHTKELEAADPFNLCMI